MRFTDNGPILPDTLLDKRDAGQVVFFCGAGVSMNAGMPDFETLTNKVIEFFTPPEETATTGALDQAFHHLQQEYGRKEVNKQVTKSLTPLRGQKLPKEHACLLRLSANQSQQPQIVTTNFDRLFEKSIAKNTKIHVPPSLPNLSLNQSITGITYLHGRLSKNNDDQYPYILSSADFGRAYLAEGWATNFVRALLEKFTVILVGYQAEDPPIRYLLEGLNRDETTGRSNLYAFDKGRLEDMEAKWHDKGVTPIAYQTHDILWETLAMWAAQADDPRQWRAKTVQLAENAPKTLKPHQRGQVAHLIRTTQGAKLFCNAQPAAHPEWICVFDAQVRKGKISQRIDWGQREKETETFDPLIAYGLDDDPPRGSASDRSYRQYLDWLSGDTNPSYGHRLSLRVQPVALPPRISTLASWVGNNLQHPAMAWWVARQWRLHPKFLDDLQRELWRAQHLPPYARRIWNLILDHHADQRHVEMHLPGYRFHDRVNNDGWTASTLRALSNISQPLLTCKIEDGLHVSRPPWACWATVKTNQIAHFKISWVDQHGWKITVPDDQLVPVLRILQESFFQAMRMIEEAECYYNDESTCYPDRHVKGDHYPKNGEKVFIWLVSLFDQLCKFCPASAKNIAGMWPIHEEMFFRKLKLYALNQPALFAARQVVDEIFRLNEEQFWNRHAIRELMFLMADRWTDFTKGQQRRLVRRILKGPPQGQQLRKDQHLYEVVARYLRFLEIEGCILPMNAQKKLQHLTDTLPDWGDGWATGMVTRLGATSGAIKENRSHGLLENVPPGKVIDTIEKMPERRFSEFCKDFPFKGLVRDKPRKALLTLRFEAGRAQHLNKYWQQAVEHWPEGASDRLDGVFLRRLTKLPLSTLFDIRYYLGSKISDKFADIYQKNLTLLGYLLTVVLTLGRGTQAPQRREQSTLLSLAR